ncbi:UDP-N-acetylglucosamine 4,6-dehydratase (inverting) [Pokkaliibacter sp. MBI-7]|uniref:UDP-N-acetylglucosamine 4,6-dehydratase (inverting) n=1 Tax=Pokkaliibacter sp. MBI-7 TaxID=3040600 RepID=UPI00244D1DA1|nr:UDP-N-acetylglucosamine 4,6-dehydratase (inverting) [Pokkaliibacter sp. MBI-7]MDH2431307.1 UDP-N-acetylglucosamine 4,6-dehydratase (inverting) [Pokkaliibacter sp. MBI-7]
MFNNRSVLVTGGTGSFGHAFVKRLLANYKPSKIVVFSRDELKQFEMEQTFNDPRMRYFIGDVRDLERLRTAMRDIDYVVHAAALKQVPAAEYNPMECIKTNILGGQNVVDAAISNGVKRVIALSTDKAANPINLYGATKLASDKLFVAGNHIAGGKGPRFSVVRYGNVAGSRGSVVPFFQQKLAQGCQVLPVTHPEMTRFWITLEQGVDFVIKNFDRMHGGEIFVPKIPSMRVLDLVDAMTGSRKHECVGIRPGEKLHEIMVPGEVSHQALEFHDHYVIQPTIALFEKVDYRLNRLGEAGTPVADGFEYHSGTNPDFLSVDQLKALL